MAFPIAIALPPAPDPLVGSDTANLGPAPLHTIPIDLEVLADLDLAVVPVARAPLFLESEILSENAFLLAALVDVILLLPPNIPIAAAGVEAFLIAIPFRPAKVLLVGEATIGVAILQPIAVWTTQPFLLLGVGDYVLFISR